MNNRNLENLHLLSSLKAILDEGSVVKAARSLDVSQSAISKHLASLRAWLDDPLFVRTADGMRPTPRAIEIRERVETILSMADQLTNTEAADPSRFEGIMTISATDEVLTILLPLLIPEIERQAPGLRLRTMPLLPDYSIHDLETGKVNLLIAVNWHAPEQLRQRKLFSDQFVCVMHKNHPLADKPLTLKKYSAAKHILVAPLGHARAALDPVLQQHGLTRDVVATVPIFGLMTEALIGADRITTLPKRVADRLVPGSPLVIRELPMPAPEINYHALWHARYEHEPRLVWLRKVVNGILKVY